jgi:hypothetical protein
MVPFDSDDSKAMTGTLLAVALALAASLPAGRAHAQVYKCVDAAGRTVYSQTPCPASAKSTTLSRTAPSTPAPDAGADAAKAGAAKDGAPRNAAEQEQAFRKRLQEQQEAQKKDAQKLADAKEKEQNCSSARSQLAQYEGGGRIARFDDKGERTYLGDDEINREKARIRALVDLWCK